MSNKTILIVDDEAAIRDMLRVALEMANYRCIEAATAQQAHALLVDDKPDLVLLDWMLPNMSGIEFARRLRREPRTRSVPIIMLTAKVEENEKILGLDAGADDYITKPFSPRELIARIKAVLRRRLPELSEEILEIDGLKLDPITHRVSIVTNDEIIKSTELTLGPTEFRLLHYLMAHKERVHSRAQLLDRVWGDHVFIEDRTVDVHIRRLRKALEDVGKDGLVQTVRGSGYRLSIESKDSVV